MTQQEIITYLTPFGFETYHGFSNILVKDNYTITLEPDQIIFEQDETGYQDYEDLSMFQTPEEVHHWILGVEDFLLDEEE